MNMFYDSDRLDEKTDRMHSGPWTLCRRSYYFLAVEPRVPRIITFRRLAFQYKNNFKRNAELYYLPVFNPCALFLYTETGYAAQCL